MTYPQDQEPAQGTMTQKKVRRLNQPKTDPARPLVPTRPVPVNETDEVERITRARQRAEQHYSQIRRPFVLPPLNRDSAYSSEEETEMMLALRKRQQNSYGNGLANATDRAVADAAEASAAAWYDPAVEVDLFHLNISFDDEDDVKPIGDRIPTRNDSFTVWDQHRALLRPNILRRPITGLKRFSVFDL